MIVHPRRVLRIVSCLVLFAVTASAVAGCSASRREPAAPSPTPAAEPAPPAPANDEATEAPASGAAAPAAQGPYAPSSTKAESERAAPPEMETWGRQLDGALTLSTPDCSMAWALRDKICDLAQRLCDIAGRSAEPEVAERCTDGRSRCERATSRVRAGCAE
jgi:hypothetical protein